MNSKKREITLGIALIPAILTILMMFCYIVDLSGASWMPKVGASETPLFGWGLEEPHIPLVFGAAVTSLTAWFCGFRWKELEPMIMHGIKMVLPAIVIMLVIGMVIGSWISSGIVAAMVYYGFIVLHPAIFLAATLLICAIVSTAIGSSWTTSSTVGMALFVIAWGIYGVDSVMVKITVGAIISGAYFGDKLSPLSDTTNLAPGVSGTDLFSHIKQMLVTTIPTFLLTFIIFVIIGLFNIPEESGSTISEIKESITLMYRIDGLRALILLVPVITITAAAMKLPAVPVLFGGALIGVLCTVFIQGQTLPDAVYALHHGFSYETVLLADGETTGLAILADNPNISDTINSTMNSLFNGRGGLSSMLWITSLILCSVSFGGILHGTGMLNEIVEAILKPVKSEAGLITATIICGIAINIFTGDQYSSVALNGTMYKDKYIEKGIHPATLSSTVETGGTITSAFVSWNVCGAFMLSVFVFDGSPISGTIDFAPYMIFNWLSVIVAIVFAYIGIGITKLTDEEKAAYEANPDEAIPLTGKISFLPKKAN